MAEKKALVDTVRRQAQSVARLDAFRRNLLATLQTTPEARAPHPDSTRAWNLRTACSGRYPAEAAWPRVRRAFCAARSDVRCICSSSCKICGLLAQGGLLVRRRCKALCHASSRRVTAGRESSRRVAAGHSEADTAGSAAVGLPADGARSRQGGEELGEDGSPQVSADRLVRDALSRAKATLTPSTTPTRTPRAAYDPEPAERRYDMERRYEARHCTCTPAAWAHGGSLARDPCSDGEAADVQGMAQTAAMHPWQPVRRRCETPWGCVAARLPPCSTQALSTGAQRGLSTGGHRQACPLPPARSRRALHTLAHGAQADNDDSYVSPNPTITPPPCGAQADDDDSYVSRTNHCERAGSSELSKSRSRSVSPTPQLIGGGQGERLDGKEFFRRCAPENPDPKR